VTVLTDSRTSVSNRDERECGADRTSGLLRQASIHPEDAPVDDSSAGYSISVSSLNIGRYIAITMIPTMIPTPIIISGSMIDVSA
jgi:hypothetical protein